MSLGFTRHPKLASLENNPLRQIEALGIVFSVDADMAQLVEHHLAKVRVAGSNPVVRSRFFQATLYGVAFSFLVDMHMNARTISGLDDELAG